MSSTFIFMPLPVMTSPGFWPAAQGPNHFAAMVMCDSAPRRDAGNWLATLARRIDLDGIGTVEIAADNRVRGDDRVTELTDRIDGDGPTVVMHVPLLTVSFRCATEIEGHKFVGGGVSALLHELSREIAALKLHLELP